MRTSTPTLAAFRNRLRAALRPRGLAAAGLALLVLAAGRPAVPAGGVREVTLLAVTDFHGALGPSGRAPGDGRPWGGAVALAQRVREQRAARPDRTFLLDAGDEMQGTPESNFTFGRAAIAVLNALGTDAAALGNHEFDWSIDTLQARRRDMHYPMLAANVFEKVSGRRPEWIQPWVVLERDGVRLGVIGFATPETPRVTLPMHVENLRFDAPEPLLPELVRAVRRRGVDLVVVLCHIGGVQRRDGEIEGPIADLARAARGVDAIVGGHTHTLVAGRAHGVPTVVAGSSGRALGRIVLRWDGGRVRGAEVDLLRAYADSLVVPAWDPLAALVDSLQRQVRPLVARVLGRAARPLGREALANLVTDAMRAAAAADVALANPGGIRRDLEAGDVTVGDVFELVPFENTLVTARFTGRALHALLESRPEKVRLAGLRGRFDAGAPAGQRFRLVHDDGTPLREDSTYVVVTNSFIAQGGDGFVGFDTAPDLRIGTLLVRDAVAGWIETETRAGRSLDAHDAPRLEPVGRPEP